MNAHAHLRALISQKPILHSQTTPPLLFLFSLSFHSFPFSVNYRRKKQRRKKRMGETNPNGQQGQAPPPPSSTAIPIHTAAAAASSRGPILPPAEQLHQLQFCIHSNPTWPEAFILAFQHYIVMLGTIVMLSSVLVPQMGGNHGDKARVIQTFLFMSGINTLLQTFIGTRLPVVMNPSFAFVIPVMTIIKDFSSRTFLDEHERFVHTMRAIQGALIVASFPNIVIGYSKAWGHYSRFFSPVVIVPVVCVVGIGLFERGFPQVGKCVEIGLPMLILLVIVQQYMKHIHEGAYFLIERFGLLACITIVWAFAGLLTVSGAYNNVSLLTKQHCRTDRSYLMSSAPWIKIPYPFQWGPPIFVASHVFGMMGAALVSAFESTGAYYAGARLAGATPPPAHVLSRSIGLQGVGMLLEGIFGAAAGSTASVENIGLLGLTRIGSRRVVQISTGFMILFSIFGKFGAFFASIPLPIFAAIYCVLFGLVAAVGVSFIQFANNNSLRNLYIIGLSLFLGISVPQYFKEYTVSAGNGPVKTNAGWNEIEAAEKRQKLKASASGQDGVTGIEDLETDPIAEVFGPDTKSRCRAISFISSAKQVKIKQAAMTISSQNKENPDTLRRLDKLENMVSEMFTYLKSTQHSQNQFFGSGTSRTEMRSNSSVHISTSSQNLNPNPASPVRNDGPTLGEKQKVILLGREREEVAKGVIAPQTICHGRVLQDDEKIVWVDEVLKPEATIYDGPQNGLSHLCEIADGGFVIWSIKRIRYM